MYKPTAGHFKTFGGPFVTRGPRVGRPCSLSDPKKFLNCIWQNVTRYLPQHQTYVLYRNSKQETTKTILFARLERFKRYCRQE